VSPLNEALAEWEGKPADSGRLEGVFRPERSLRSRFVTSERRSFSLIEGTVSVWTPSRPHNHRSGFPFRLLRLRLRALSGDTDGPGFAVMQREVGDDKPDRIYSQRSNSRR
jgi:hypothetical protein